MVKKVKEFPRGKTRYSYRKSESGNSSDRSIDIESQWKRVYSCTIKTTESSNNKSSNKDTVRPERLYSFPRKRSYRSNGTIERTKTAYRFGTRTTPIDTLRRKTNEATNTTGIDTAGYTDIELSIQLKRELFVEF